MTFDAIDQVVNVIYFIDLDSRVPHCITWYDIYTLEDVKIIWDSTETRTASSPSSNLLFAPKSPVEAWIQNLLVESIN